MTESGFILTENDIRQQLDTAQPERAPALYVLVIDSSQSMARRIDMMPDAALKLTRFLRPNDRVLVGMLPVPTEAPEPPPRPRQSLETAAAVPLDSERNTGSKPAGGSATVSDA